MLETKTMTWECAMLLTVTVTRHPTQTLVKLLLISMRGTLCAAKAMATQRRMSRATRIMGLMVGE